ncbi:MAG: phage tail assembly chaperone [Desulfovibrionaceae bacterium]
MAIAEVEIGGVFYGIGRLPARKQFHVVRRLAGALSGLGGLLPKDGALPKPEDLMQRGDLLEKLLKALSELDDATVDYVVDACLSVVSRKDRSGGWAKAMTDTGGLMFEDMDMLTMLTLTARVIQGNLSGFFDALPHVLPGAART